MAELKEKSKIVELKKEIENNLDEETFDINNDFKKFEKAKIEFDEKNNEMEKIFEKVNNETWADGELKYESY